MAEYRLHCMGESGNAYKAALMLALAGCDWEAHWVDYFNGETRGEAFRERLNELGEVPVLEHGGRRLSQSGAILTYLAERTGRFGGRDEDEKLEILRWILFDNHKFTSYFATLRFQIGIQKTGETPVTEFLRGRVLGAFGIVEKHLATRPFILGERPTIADISMVGYLYYPEETGIDRTAFPQINAWAGRIAALPGWAHPYDLMPRKATSPA
ncbi:glutathione S-transferase [Chelatococcus sp. SYSU_G07232]|uniref:Glutathione S-transferase n=1 Tax=Chelatococcus albus TaxID=3047466 RepID=A0ABT7AD91_9HYPH|nr:glutathione S-transferase [Chelatococcus sp. SYSU_G07232]MDJ1157352.1 glutathione S-transferase [Chelatococcus sp. SYSU_G07232]